MQHETVRITNRAGQPHVRGGSSHNHDASKENSVQQLAWPWRTAVRTLVLLAAGIAAGGVGAQGSRPQPSSTDRADAPLPKGPPNPKHDEIVMIGPDKWQAHNGSKTHSLTIKGPTYRFEVKKGDRAPFDSEAKERSELASLVRIPAGKLFRAKFEFMVEPGPVTDRQWLIPFQIHQDDPSSAPQGSELKNSIGVSPLFGLYIIAKDGREVLQVRGETSPTSPLKQFPDERIFAEVPFERGTRHSVVMEVIDNNGVDTEPFEPGTEWRGHSGRNGNFGKGTGLLRVTYNGKTIVDRPNIPMGYGHAAPSKGGRGSYAKFGIYAGASPDPGNTAPIVVHFYRIDTTIGAERS